MSAPRHRRGMTLLEVLVVIAIIALLVAALPLRGFGALDGVELRAAGRDLATHLRRARATAMQTGAAARFVLDVETGRYGRTGEERLPDGLDIRFDTARQDLLGADAGSVVFMPDGSATGGTITLTRDERQVRVEVAWLTGQVKLHVD